GTGSPNANKKPPRSDAKQNQSRTVNNHLCGLHRRRTHRGMQIDFKQNRGWFSCLTPAPHVRARCRLRATGVASFIAMIDAGTLAVVAATLTPPETLAAYVPRNA